jgi:hypothetical protein
MVKQSEVFDRDFEWSALDRFISDKQATDTESLARVGDALTAHLAPPSPFHFASCGEAVDALLDVGIDRPVPADQAPPVRLGPQRHEQALPADAAGC